jgi:2-C-methyl-D-erythritol 4-phosphate cytidylyltransferase
VKVAAVIPAAGRGVRLGGAAPKQYLPLAGVPIIDAVVVVVPPGDESRCRCEAVEPYGFVKVRAIVPGGASRQESVARGLDAVEDDASYVVVHDAARPLVSEGLIRRVVEAAAMTGAALAAVPVTDTLKRRVAAGGMLTTVDREGLWAAQTPQAFRTSLLREALARAATEGFVGTDDASVVERLGAAVALVEGEAFNLKITRAEDLVLAEELFARLSDPSARMAPQGR